MDLLTGLEWQSTHEREFGIYIWEFPNLCLKIQNGEAKFEFFLVYLELINHRVNA
jgi:hypothetical protein